MDENQQPNPQLQPGSTIIPGPQQPVPEPNLSEGLPKKLIFTLVGFILLIIFGAVGLWVLLSHNNQSAPSTSSTTTQTSAAKSPDSIAYAARAKDSDPYSIYWHSAQTDERIESMKLAAGLSPASSDVSGQNVAFASDDGIYVSHDGGKIYKNVYPLDPAKAKQNQAVTSLHFSSDGQKVVFAFLPGLTNGQPKNTVNIMDLDGQNATDLTSFDNTAGVFIYHYDVSGHKLIYATGCYFCDGGPGYPHIMDVKTKEDKQLFKTDPAAEIYNGVEVSPDGSNQTYFTGTNDKDVAAQTGGVGWQGAPPYKIKQLNISNGQINDLATVGSLHDMTADGKFRLYAIQVGYTLDNKPWYAADKKLFVYRTNNFSNVFEGSNNISTVMFASLDRAVVGTTDSKNVTTLTNYDVASQKPTIVLQGDSNTVFFGATTK